MKKVNKTQSSKKGFTTIEVLLVTAIIVILSGVTIGGIRGMIANAKKNATAVELHAGCFYVVDPNGPATLPGTTTPNAWSSPVLSAYTPPWRIPPRTASRGKTGSGKV